MWYKTIEGQWFVCEFNEPLDFYDQYYFEMIFSKGHFLLKRYSGINSGKINEIDIMGPFPCIVAVSAHHPYRAIRVPQNVSRTFSPLRHSALPHFCNPAKSTVSLIRVAKTLYTTEHYVKII